MRKLSNTKGGKNKIRNNGKTTNQYLKQILMNIQNLQHTILQKLDKTSKHDEAITIPLTPKRQNNRPLQNTSNREAKYNTYFSKKQTPKQVYKKSSGTKKCPQNSLVLFHDDLDLNQQSYTFYPGKKNSDTKTSKDKVKTENFINYYTVRCKQKTISKDKNDQYRSITERIGNEEHSKCQRKIISSKQIELREKLDNKTQNSTVMETSNSNTKNEIQLFYKNEINKLEVDQKIKQLQSQLQNCLSNKKVANLSEFHFIRSRMKRISVEINQLKQKRYNLKRQVLK